MSAISKGYLMSKDRIVAEINNDRVHIIDENRCPLFFKEGSDIGAWIESRAVDKSRVNARLIKKALGIRKTDDINTVMYVNAACITDNFWIKEEGEDLTWEKNIKYLFNHYDKLALNGDITAFDQEPSHTPELTNIGSFDKCWRREDGKWWLYKKENEETSYSEYFIYRVGKDILHFDMAVYEITDSGVKSLDFTNNNQYNYEPISSLIGENEDYLSNFELLNGTSPELAKDYLKIIYTDILVRNFDRHTFNYGILSDAETGEIIKLAPNFDNNTALIMNGIYPKVNSAVAFDDMLIELLQKSEEALALFKEIEIPEIRKEDLKKINDSISIDVNKDAIEDFLIEHQKVLAERIDEISKEKSKSIQL